MIGVHRTTHFVFLLLVAPVISIQLSNLFGVRTYRENGEKRLRLQLPRTENPSTTGIWCHSCVSGELSNLSRALFLGTLQIPHVKEPSICNDSFDNIRDQGLFKSSSTEQSPGSQWGMEDTSTGKYRRMVAVQTCKSPCVKAVFENSNARIVLRGCLTSIYQQVNAKDYKFTAPGVGTCDKQSINSKHGGFTSTITCLCTSDFCNTADTFHVKHMETLMFALIAIYLFV